MLFPTKLIYCNVCPLNLRRIYLWIAVILFVSIRIMLSEHHVSHKTLRLARYAVYALADITKRDCLIFTHMKLIKTVDES